ncbi:uncharacterized protein A4U43_C09F9810 [Asparagus officinalis]|uniref:Uncharacterized protein n=1 Tax=Asparagus officinalis TaxID=4686 RepID=A0A5P1E6F6_ASPOF|nr:uncharacterized protein A4U43_C09F9810 [Asparagus officinalis]
MDDDPSFMTAAVAAPSLSRSIAVACGSALILPQQQVFVSPPLLASPLPPRLRPLGLLLVPGLRDPRHLCAVRSDVRENEVDVEEKNEVVDVVEIETEVEQRSDHC